MSPQSSGLTNHTVDNACQLDAMSHLSESPSSINSGLWNSLLKDANDPTRLFRDLLHDDEILAWEHSPHLWHSVWRTQEVLSHNSPIMPSLDVFSDKFPFKEPTQFLHRLLANSPNFGGPQQNFVRFLLDFQGTTSLSSGSREWVSEWVSLSAFFKQQNREISPVTQTTPEPTLLIWGGWPLEKNPPPLAKLPNLVLSSLSGHSDPIVLEPFDVTFDNQVPRTPNLPKISSGIESDIRNGFFSTLHTALKVNQVFMTIINKVAWKCIWCCHQVQWCITAPKMG